MDISIGQLIRFGFFFAIGFTMWGGIINLLCMQFNKKQNSKNKKFEELGIEVNDFDADMGWFLKALEDLENKESKDG